MTDENQDPWFAQAVPPASPVDDFMSPDGLNIFGIEQKASGDLLMCIDGLKKDSSDRYKVDKEKKFLDMAEMIFDDMRSKGRFYHYREGSILQLFWYDLVNNKLYEIQSEHFLKLFFWKYDLISTTLLGKSVYSIISNRCFMESPSITPRRFSYYDEAKNILYRFNNDNRIFKLDGEKIEIVSNGTDGIFFETEFDAEPIEPKYTENDLLNALLFDQINFKSTDELTYTDMYFLFGKWFYAIFFPELFQTKPICLLWGEKGSGKTSLFQVIKKILTGRLGDVETAPEKIEHFIPLITSQHFIAMDNVDGYIKWLNDMLAQCSTGMAITLRQLYKTNQAIRFHPRVFIGITSRDPRFRRDDVADRLLIFKVKRFDRFTPQSEILENIIENRNELWGDILIELNKIVQVLGEKKGEKIRSPFRLADFYSFVKKTSPDDSEIDGIFEKMSKAQNDYVLENEPIFEFLTIFMDGKFEESMSTGAWYKRGQEVMEAKRLDWYKTSRSFGMHLKSIMVELNTYYKAELSEGTRNVKILTIKNK